MGATVSTADREHASPDAAPPRAPTNGERDREETLSVVATSLAAVATAWSAFQAATWSGRQTFALAQSGKLRELSTEARLEGDQQTHLDADLFVAFTGAYTNGNDKYATFLRDRFPPRLKKAMDAWLATKPLTSRDAPPHPFAMAEYKVEAREHALALGKSADEAMVHASEANRTSDTFVLGTVIFASIILLASLAVRLHGQRQRRAMIVLSTLALLAALVWLALLPVAWVG